MNTHFLGDIHIIAIAGGSCSGKTRLAQYTREALNGTMGDDKCTVVRQDNYYLDLGGAEPGQTLPNFDHPDAFDWDLFLTHLRKLKSGQAVDIPTYDFTTHRRTDITERVEPKPIMLIEGILILSQKLLLPIFDYKFFVACAQDIRFDRRVRRDVLERGRTLSCIKTQFGEQVVPMHEKFVEPSKHNADIIVTQDQCGLDTIMGDGPLISLCNNLLEKKTLPKDLLGREILSH